MTPETRSLRFLRFLRLVPLFIDVIDEVTNTIKGRTPIKLGPVADVVEVERKEDASGEVKDPTHKFVTG